MTPAERWLRDHLHGVPPQLLSAMIAALPERADSVPDALADAALRLYSDVVDRGSDRANALPLLAADALLTHAFQAQASMDPDGIAALATRWGPAGRLARLVPETEEK